MWRKTTSTSYAVGGYVLGKANDSLDELTLRLTAANRGTLSEVTLAAASWVRCLLPSGADGRCCGRWRSGVRGRRIGVRDLRRGTLASGDLTLRVEELD